MMNGGRRNDVIQQDEIEKKKKKNRISKRSNQSLTSTDQNNNPRTEGNQFDNLIQRLQKTSFNQNNHKSKKSNPNSKKKNNINSEEQIQSKIIKQHYKEPSNNTSHSIPSPRLDWASQVEAASRSDAEEDQLPDLTEWEEAEKGWKRSTNVPTIHLSIPSAKPEYDQSQQQPTRTLDIQSRTEILHPRLSNHPVHVQLGPRKPSSVHHEIKPSSLTKENGTIEEKETIPTTSTLSSKGLSVDTLTQPKKTKAIKAPTLLDSIHRPTSPNVISSTTTKRPSTKRSILNQKQKQSIAKSISRPHTPLSPPSTSTSTTTTPTAARSLSSSIGLMPSSSSSTSGSTPRDDTSFDQKINSDINHRSDHLTLTCPSSSLSTSTNSPPPTESTSNSPLTHLSDLQPACSTLKADLSLNLLDPHKETSNVAKTNPSDKPDKELDSTDHPSSAREHIAEERKDSDIDTQETVLDKLSDSRLMEGVDIQKKEVKEQILAGSTASGEQKETLVQDDDDGSNKHHPSTLNLSSIDQQDEDQEQVKEQESKSNVNKINKKKKTTKKKKKTETTDESLNLQESTNSLSNNNDNSIQQPRSNNTHSNSSNLILLNSSSSPSSTPPPPTTTTNPILKSTIILQENKINHQHKKASVHLFDKLTGGTLLHP